MYIVVNKGLWMRNHRTHVSRPILMKWISMRRLRKSRQADKNEKKEKKEEKKSLEKTSIYIIGGPMLQ